MSYVWCCRRHCWKNGVSVYENLYCRLFWVEKSHRDFVKARCHSDNLRVLWLCPNKVFRAWVDTLDFPWDSEPIRVQCATVPHPSCCTVLSNQSLVELLLVKQMFWVVDVRHFGLHLIMKFLESLVNIINICTRNHALYWVSYLIWGQAEHKHPWCSIYAPHSMSKSLPAHLYYPCILWSLYQLKQSKKTYILCSA